VLEARRTYADAVKWIRAARPRRIYPGLFAMRAFWGSLAVGIVLLGVLGLISPSLYVPQGAASLGKDWQALVLLGLVTVAVIGLLSRRRDLGRLTARAREPFARPLTGERGFEGAAGCLAACPAPLQTRFALSWVWGPVAVAGLGVVFAFACAYFLVDAVLSTFRVAWGHPVYAGAFAVLGILCFRIAAVRLATWRVAMSAHRDATTGYPE
jgi:hypothetical protein